MFTIRFMKQGKKGHISFSCSEYETTHKDGSVEVRMVMKDGSDVFEEVGPEQLHSIAYVTNEAGRTIDKVTL